MSEEEKTVPALVVVAVATGALSGGAGGADSDNGGRVPAGADSLVLMPVMELCDGCCVLW